MGKSINVITTNLKVEIRNLDMDNRGYSFDYKLWVNGKLKSNNAYSSSHSWGDNYSKLRRILRNGYAVRLVMQTEM